MTSASRARARDLFLEIVRQRKRFERKSRRKSRLPSPSNTQFRCGLIAVYFPRPPSGCYYSSSDPLYLVPRALSLSLCSVPKGKLSLYSFEAIYTATVRNVLLADSSSQLSSARYFIASRTVYRHKEKRERKKSIECKES